MKVLIVDNYDSFTWNLYQQIGRLTGVAPIVARNDAIDLAGLQALGPSHIVLSPGPGSPEVPRDFGVCADAIRHLGAATPILGVCLGHQGLIHHLGGRVGRAPSIVHGKVWRIEVLGGRLFEGLPRDLEVMRYHSLVGLEIPPALRVTARTADGLVMAVEHETWPMHGVQFHPESIGTPLGDRIVERFLSE